MVKKYFFQGPESAYFLFPTAMFPGAVRGPSWPVIVDKDQSCNPFFSILTLFSLFFCTFGQILALNVTGPRRCQALLCWGTAWVPICAVRTEACAVRHVRRRNKEEAQQHQAVSFANIRSIIYLSISLSSPSNSKTHQTWLCEIKLTSRHGSFSNKHPWLKIKLAYKYARLSVFNFVFAARIFQI